MTVSSTVTRPTVGTYDVEPGTSVIRFTTKHMFGLGTVTGSFSQVRGQIVVAEDPTRSTVTATALANSFNTGTAGRDDKVKSPTFLDPASHPHLTFRSAELAETADGWVLRGELTVVGGTAPLDLLVTGVRPTATGMSIIATAQVDRYAHGITAMKGMAGRWLALELEVHANRV